MITPRTSTGNENVSSRVPLHVIKPCRVLLSPLSQQASYLSVSSRPIAMNWESKYVQDFHKEVEKNGLSNSDSIAKFFESKMDGWKEVQVDIAITGNSAVGKSSFINTIRG